MNDVNITHLSTPALPRINALWFALTGGIGIDDATFTGPFLTVLGFAQYLLPLAMLQWYFRCQTQAAGVEARLFSAVLLLLTLFMGLGIFAATAGMWLPRMV